MVKINLRAYYPGYYKKDTYIMVSEDVAAALEADRRKNEALKASDRRHRASLDLLDGTVKNLMIVDPIEDLDKLHEFEKIYSSFSILTKKQQIRMYEYFFLGLSISEISEKEGCEASSVSRSIKSSVKKIKKFFNLD